jgi:hypothetical protein
MNLSHSLDELIIPLGASRAGWLGAARFILGYLLIPGLRFSMKSLGFKLKTGVLKPFLCRFAGH